MLQMHLPHHLGRPGPQSLPFFPYRAVEHSGNVLPPIRCNGDPRTLPKIDCLMSGPADQVAANAINPVSPPFSGVTYGGSTHAKLVSAYRRSPSPREDPCYLTPPLSSAASTTSSRRASWDSHASGSSSSDSARRGSLLARHGGRIDKTQRYGPQRVISRGLRSREDPSSIEPGRETHADKERQRRERIRESTDTLRALVPSCNGDSRADSKEFVLHEAGKYIVELQDARGHVIEERQQLLHGRDQLRKLATHGRSLHLGLRPGGEAEAVRSFFEACDEVLSQPLGRASPSSYVYADAGEGRRPSMTSQLGL
ncbi:MAG: hypothetical protein M1817_006019 [Caeruleum heppii]|nr:MAG: hypothetical protein M1817_006019 [Caeruleum heppii]